MRSQVATLCGVVLSLLACESSRTTSVKPCDGCLTLMPPMPGLSGRIRVVAGEGQPPGLQVLVFLVNRTPSPLALLHCPMVVRLAPFPPGSLDTGHLPKCESSAARERLFPGDSTVITRVLTADSLALFGPGQYFVGAILTYAEISGTDDYWVVGVPSGVIQLPLDSTSQPIDSTLN